MGLSILATLRGWFPRRGLRVEVVRTKGAAALPCNPNGRIIERTSAWSRSNRRLVRDYEQREVNRAARILVAMSKLMLERLAKR